MGKRYPFLLIALAVVILISVTLFSQVLPIPGFNQAYRDAHGYWGGCRMGTRGCPDRIETAGCLITSLAAVLDYYGITLAIPASASCTGAARSGMDPGILNDWLRTHGGYGHCAGDNTGDCCLEWTAVPKAVKLYEHENAYSAGIDEISRKEIDRALAQGYPVIAGVHWGAHCHGTTTKTENCHWIVITGKAGTTYTITDPYNRDKKDPRGVRTTLNAGVFGAYTIDRFVVVEGHVPTSYTRIRISVSADQKNGLFLIFTGSPGEFLVFARVIDPEGNVSYIRSLDGTASLYQKKIPIFAAPVRLTPGKNRVLTGPLPGDLPGSYTVEVWIESPDRSGERVAADIAHYTVSPPQQPTPTISLPAALLLASGLAMMISLLVWLVVIAAK